MTSSIDRLRAHGFRLTPQRLTVLQILNETSGHLSALEICQLANTRLPGMTEATVYRTLDFLVEQGLALAAHIGSGRIVYESANHHHDHLICRHCGHTAEIDHADLHTLFESFEKTTGFHIDSSHVTFFGLCPDCYSSVEPTHS